jgi:uncharacterized membrane protein
MFVATVISSAFTSLTCVLSNLGMISCAPSRGTLGAVLTPVGAVLTPVGGAVLPLLEFRVIMGLGLGEVWIDFEAFKTCL